MTKEEVIDRIKHADNRRALARASGVPYGYLNKLVYGEIKNPGSDQIDRLRSYLLSIDIMRGRQ